MLGKAPDTTERYENVSIEVLSERPLEGSQVDRGPRLSRP